MTRVLNANQKRPGKRKSIQKSDAILGYLFILPSFLGLVVFLLFPIIASFVISLFNWSVLSSPTFLGFSNFRELFGDDTFLTALGNTFKWVVFYVPISIIVSFALALAMDMPIKGISFFRALFYLPVVAPLVVVSLLFTWIFNFDFGILNFLLEYVKIKPIGWLSEPSLAIFSIALMSIWKWAGYNMLIFLAALQGIPESLYEAAELDGIRPLQKLRYIKIPLMMPSIYFVVLTCVIDAFQVFTEVFIMTMGGPGYSTYTVSFYIWTAAFKYSRMGYACAMAVIMFIIIMLVTFIQDNFLNKRVQYED